MVPYAGWVYRWAELDPGDLELPTADRRKGRAISDFDRAQAIGRVAGNFAALELVLGALVAQLADVGLEPVQQLLADDSFDKVLHKTRLIARERLTEEGFQAINDWLKRGEDAW